MNISRALIFGAGSPLADSLAGQLQSTMEVVGIAAKPISDKRYTEIVRASPSDPVGLFGSIKHLLSTDKPFVTIVCYGRFHARRRIADLTQAHDDVVLTSNICGFLTAYRATIEASRRCRGAYVTFGSVSQRYRYPLLGVFTAAKEALRSLVLTASHEEEHVRFFHFNLSTLDKAGEDRYTNKLVGKFLSCSDVAKVVAGYIGTEHHIQKYTEVNLYEYSDQYYAKGYLDRVPDCEHEA